MARLIRTQISPEIFNDPAAEMSAQPCYLTLRPMTFYILCSSLSMPICTGLNYNSAFTQQGFSAPGEITL